MKQKRLLTMLALLLTAVTGVWAQSTYTVTFAANGNTKTVENVTLPKTFQCSYSNANGELDLILKELYGWTGDKSETVCANWSTPTSSDANKVVAGKNGNDHYITIDNVFEGTVTITGDYIVDLELTQYSLEISIAEPTEWSLTPDETGKTWTLAKMPAYDVELTPIYAPKAKFATDGNLVLTPTAAEGIIAGTEDAIVNAGTVVEGQGTAMYFATTDAEMTAEKAAAADGWLSTLPTAAGYDDATTVYVWYYIKGADTPQGQKATAENTFNDSEICATPITVTVLSNKFDIEFKAANANTIEAGKATVKVGETAAEVKEGKLEGVKMNSKVTITAKEGYKFRKVEVKKGIVTLKTITIEDVVLVYEDGDNWEKIKDRNPGKVVCNTYVFIKGSVVLLNGSPVSQTDVIVPDGAYTLGFS